MNIDLREELRKRDELLITILLAEYSSDILLKKQL